MTLSRPRASVSIDGRTLTSAEGALARLRVSLGFGPAHDAVELALWPSSRFAAAGAGAAMSVALGEAGSEVDVWTGTVADVRAAADGVVIDGLATTAALATARVSHTFLDQSVADVIEGLVQEQSMAIDEVAGDAKLSAYSVDTRRSVWAHVLDLAALAGADVSATAGGRLRVVPPRTGTADATLRFGADVLAWSGGASAPATAATVAASGAASEAGSDKWHWLLREPTAAGSGPVGVVAALHTRDAAESMAKALTARASRSSVGARLRVVGAPAIRPGDLLEVADLPSGDLGVLRVLSVEHRLDGARGFVTALTAEGAA